MPAPRSRARLLARAGRLPQTAPALVCPLILAQAAEIEALPADRFLADATKLANGLRALHGAFGTDVIVTAAADDLAVVAAGDPGHPRVTAAVEATRRLAATAEDAALAAALCGPTALAARLGRSPAEPAELERSGAVLLALAKAFLGAGVHLLLVVEPERVPPQAAGGWRSAVSPLVNVARFRQAAAGVVLGDAADAGLAPRGAVVCLPPSVAGPGHGIALSTDPSAWAAPTRRPAGVPLVTTLGPVQGGFAACRAAAATLSAAGA